MPYDWRAHRGTTSGIGWLEADALPAGAVLLPASSVRLGCWHGRYVAWSFRGLLAWPLCGLLGFLGTQGLARGYQSREAASQDGAAGAAPAFVTHVMRTAARVCADAS